MGEVAERALSALAGKRVVVTRAAAQCEVLSEALSARGAIPVILPLISFAEPEDFGPVDAAIREMNRFDWVIYTSAQAVRAVAKRCETLGLKLVQKGNQPQVAAVGPVSAEAARGVGHVVAHVAQTHNGVALAEELGERLRGRSVVLPRSDRANPDLPEALRRHGARVTEVIAYRTLPGSEFDQQSLQRLVAGRVDAMLFFSPSAVQHFVELIGKEKIEILERKIAWTAVGSVTAGALKKMGVRRLLMSTETSAESVVEALERHFAEDTSSRVREQN